MEAQDLKRASARDLTRMAISGATRYHRGRDPSSVWRYSFGLQHHISRNVNCGSSSGQARVARKLSFRAPVPKGKFWMTTTARIFNIFCFAVYVESDRSKGGRRPTA